MQTFWCKKIVKKYPQKFGIILRNLSGKILIIQNVALSNLSFIKTVLTEFLIKWKIKSDFYGLFIFIIYFLFIKRIMIFINGL